VRTSYVTISPEIGPHANPRTVISKKSDPMLTLDVPRPGGDRPSWVKVGVIAAVGFVIGVAWPKLAGVRLGPSAPADTGTSAGAPHANDAPAAALAAASPASPATSAPAGSAPAATLPAVPAPPPSGHALAIKGGVLVSCRTEEGETLKGKACGSLAFDAIAVPRLKKLTGCQAADGAEGKLSITFRVDFPKNRVSVDVNRSSTDGNLDTFAGCLRPSLEGVSLSALEHEHPRYSVSYALTISPAANGKPAANGASTPASTPSAERAADGTAQVVWEVAIVRDTPRTGQVIARLQRGTPIKVGSGQEGWYRVQYGDTFTSEGWVYRGAIGK